MKGFFGVVLLSVVFICSDVSAQITSLGRCPQSKPTFGICTFDPNTNCLEDSQCQGGKLCCSEGCNKVCKDPVQDDTPQKPSPSLEIKHCPGSSTQAGICTFDPNTNCLEDKECSNGQLCCSEGCNKVCKEPVTFQPIKPQPKPAFVKN